MTTHAYACVRHIQIIRQETPEATRSDQNKSKYKLYRNKLKVLLNKTETTYYKDLKQTWKMIKYVLNRQIQQSPLEMFAINGSMSSDKATIAHAFNEYFTNLGTLAGKIPNLSRNPLSYLTGDFRDSCVLYETTKSEIINTVNRLKSKTSAGHDDIPVDIMNFFFILHSISG